MPGHYRRLFFEQLEDRRLLAGVTLITHGFNSSVDGWVTQMAEAISSRPDLSGIDQVRHRVDVTDPGHDGGPLNVVNTSSSGPSPTDEQTDDPEIVILLNWSDVAGTLGLSPGYTRSTTDVAAAVAEKLVLPGFLTGLPTAVAELPMHLMGHSRGASLVGALARELGELGVWVDQVSTLDPHPVDGVREPSPPFNFDFGDAAMTSWESVVYWDNYWRSEGTSSFDFTGEAVADTFDVELSESVLSVGGYDFEHSDVHLWYYGTIDTSTDPPAHNGDEEVPNGWYGGAHPARDASGYYYSRTVGGTRELAGLSNDLGGTAQRSAIDWTEAVWPNVMQLTIDSAEAEFTVGDAIPVSFYYQYFEDFGESATINFSLDADRNPYNGNELALDPQLSRGETGQAPTQESVDLLTTGVAAGTYYPSARISNATGQSRYAYAHHPIGVSDPDPPTIGEADIAGWANGDWWVAKSTGTGFVNEHWTSWATAADWQDVQVADVNGDGLDDIVGRANGGWWVAKSTGTSFVNEHWTNWSTAVDWQDVQVADVNDDGLDDIVGRANGGWWVAKSTGTGFVNEHWTNWSTAVDWQDVQVADVNDDGLDDIVGRANGGWWVAKSTGTSLVNELWTTWSTAVDWQDVQVADVNDDGLDDIVGRANGGWWVAKSTGTSLVNEHWTSWSTAVDWQDVQVADVNDDGLDDIVGRANGGWWVAKSTGTGFVNEHWTSWSTTVEWQDVQVADVSGDGRDDIVGRANGSWWVAKSTGTGFVNEHWTSWSVAADWQNVLVGDFSNASPLLAAGGEASSASSEALTDFDSTIW